MRALLGTASHFCAVGVLESRTAPIGTTFSSRIFRVIWRGAHTMCKRGPAVITMQFATHPPAAARLLKGRGEVKGEGEGGRERERRQPPHKHWAVEGGCSNRLGVSDSCRRCEPCKSRWTRRQRHTSLSSHSRLFCLGYSTPKHEISHFLRAATHGASKRGDLAGCEPSGICLGA